LTKTVWVTVWAIGCLQTRLVTLLSAQFLLMSNAFRFGVGFESNDWLFMQSGAR
jgi:hypothetical protein